MSMTMEFDCGHSTICPDSVSNNCAICELATMTRDAAGYIPQFVFRRYNRRNQIFNVTCDRGHSYTTSLGNFKTCEICKIACMLSHEYTPVDTNCDNKDKLKFRCAAGHIFYAHKDATDCYCCKMMIGLQQRTHPEKFICKSAANKIFWSKYAYALVCCNDCNRKFYASSDSVKCADSTIHICPHSSSSSYAIKVLEEYYEASMDETLEIGPGKVLRVAGYNSALKIAILSVEELRFSAATAETETYCKYHGINLFKVSDVEHDKIKNVLAQQISAYDRLPLRDVMLRIQHA